MNVWHTDWQAPEADSHEASLFGAVPEDDLMQEVLAEQRTSGEDNELKEQIVLQLNAIEDTVFPGQPEENLAQVDEVTDGMRGAGNNFVKEEDAESHPIPDSTVQVSACAKKTRVNTITSNCNYVPFITIHLLALLHFSIS